MKFMINGALTLGTLNGANVEIHEAVGDDNIFLFGMTTPEVTILKNEGYNPMVYYQNNNIIKRAIDEMVTSGFGGCKYADIAHSLTTTDPYMVLADFEDYSRAQQKASDLYGDPMRWNRMSLLNIANAGRFAADRAIRDYATYIWGAKPVK